MKVLALGGTGAMGKHLVSILSNNGIDTVVTSRREQKPQENLRYIKGNAHDLDFLASILTDNWDVIVDFMVYSTSEFKDRVELLLNSTKQYIFLSSSRVYADSSTPITEESPRLLDVCKDKDYLNSDEYALAKARQEDVLKKSNFKNWTIIRPYITFSENRLQLGDLEKENWLYRAINNRTIVFSNDISSKLTTLTYGFDVANVMSKFIGELEALGEVFHITVSESHRWEQIFMTYIDVLEKKFGRKPKTFITDKSPFMQKKQVQYDRIFNRQFDNTKISSYTKNVDFTSTLPGIKHCLEAFLNNPTFLAIDWKKEAFLDKITGERSSLKEIKSTKQKILYLLIRYIIPYELIYSIHQKSQKHGN